MMFDLAKRLCETPGVSGDEKAVRDIILDEIRDYADCRVDALGNLIAFKKGARRAGVPLMLCAHMDEVGLMVTYVEESGLLRFGTVGGIDPRVILGRRVLVGHARHPGVIATKPVHLQSSAERATAPDIDKLYIDIGALSREQAMQHVAPGDAAVFDTRYTEYGNGFIRARALDDRMGCALLAALIRSELPVDCTFVFSVQEETGSGAAGAAAFSVRPQAAIVVETTTAADIPFVEEDRKVCFLGKGPVISFMDRRTLYDRELFDLALRLAKEKGIACQVKQAVAGGNDAGIIHTSAGGIRPLAVSLAGRYLHSPGCVIKKSDAEEALRLLRELIPAVAGA